MAEKIPAEKAKKKRQKEDEYFAQQEARKIEELRKKQDAERAEAQEKHLKDKHWMRCPKCGQELREKEYDKVTIDQCEGCGGVWLDAGEMEILQKSQSSGLLKGLLKSVTGS